MSDDHIVLILSSLVAAGIAAIAAVTAAWLAHHWALKNAIRVNDLRIKQETYAELQAVCRSFLIVLLSKWNIRLYDTWVGFYPGACEGIRLTARQGRATLAQLDGQIPATLARLDRGLGVIEMFYPGQFSTSIKMLRQAFTQTPDISGEI